MIAGDMIHKVQIKKRDLTTDALGGHSYVYTLLKEVWASVDEAGAQARVATVLQQNVTHFITMRKLNDFPTMNHVRVLTDMFIFHRGDMFRVVSVKDADERGINIVVSAEQVKK